MTDNGNSFWPTTAGMITAIAALITALVGVLGILVQTDLIGGTREETPAEADTPAGAGGNPALSEEAPGPPDTSALISWDKATATLVRKDGTGTTVKAPTVALACATEELQFKNGQRISLQRVRSIQFDAVFSDYSSADGVVTLLDGQTLTDPIHTWNCPVTGANELG